MVRRELLEITKRLGRMEDELSHLREIINGQFSQEEQVILSYEASVGREYTFIEGASEAEKKQYADACRRYLRFGQETDACMAGKLSQMTAVWVGSTPELLKEAGCGEMDLYITQKHLRAIHHVQDGPDNVQHYHGIELKQIKQLPELLQRPLAVIAGKEQPEVLTAVLDARDRQGGQLIMPIRKNGNAFYHNRRTEANFILSVYGKQDILIFLERAQTEGRLLFEDKKNISITLGRKPLQSRQFLSTDAYKDTIPHLTGEVKTLEEKKPASKEKSKGLDGYRGTTGTGLEGPKKEL